MSYAHTTEPTQTMFLPFFWLSIMAGSSGTAYLIIHSGQFGQAGYSSQVGKAHEGNIIISFMLMGVLQQVSGHNAQPATKSSSSVPVRPCLSTLSVCPLS